MIAQVLIGTASPSPLMYLIALVSSVRSAGLWCIKRISLASSFLITVDPPQSCSVFISA